MPRLPRRAGPIGIALTLLDLWRKLPPEQRRRALEMARKHGPRVASKAMKVRSGRRR